MYFLVLYWFWLGESFPLLARAAFALLSKLSLSQLGLNHDRYMQICVKITKQTEYIFWIDFDFLYCHPITFVLTFISLIIMLMLEKGR